MEQTIQPMPPLTAEQLEALRADIEEHGVLVPVTVDQHGRIIDGNNRFSIASELGIDCPRRVVEIADDDHAHDLALTLNCARRHLTQEQRRTLIRNELVRRWEDSDRAIARRIGCSPTTVGTVRAEFVAEAEERDAAIRELVREARMNTAVAAIQLHACGGKDESGRPWQSVGDLLERLMRASCEKGSDKQLVDSMWSSTFGVLFDQVRGWVCGADCEVCDDFDRQWRHDHPGQVWRHTDPPEDWSPLLSNLDTQAVGQ